MAAAIRAEIEAETRCTASAGVSHNLLLARLATKQAKPDGHFCITPDQACVSLPVSLCSCLFPHGLLAQSCHCLLWHAWTWPHQANHSLLAGSVALTAAISRL